MSKKKKGARESSPPTNVSSPIRGANQDQSGYGVKHSTADYTISDETQYDEGFVAGVGAVRATPIQMNSTPRGRKERNAPRSSSGLQRAADKRRMQLDRVAQKRAQMQKTTKEKLIARRQHNEELSLTNLAKKVGAESKAKMPNDKLTHSFKKFSEFNREIGEQIGIQESRGTYNEKEPAHVAARKSTYGMPNMQPHYHDDGSVTIKVHGSDKGVSSVRMVDHHHDVNGLGYNRSAKSYAKLTKKKGGLIHSTKKTGPDSHEIHIMKEEVEYMEEGRPKKNATSEDPGSDHIVMQLRKAISLRGQHPVKFVNGKSSLVSPATAHRLLTMHDNMKTAAEKDHFAKHIHKSVDHMRDALAGKMPEPEKKGISLGGSHGDHRK